MNAAADIFCIDAFTLADLAEEILPLIPVSYAEAYKKNIAKRQTALEKLAAGYLLYRVLGVSGEDRLMRNVYGKPYLKERPGEAPRYFSLSDDEGIAVLAAADFEIGADVHRIGITDARLMRKMLPEIEYAAFLAASPEEKSLLFAETWTALEAKVKCLGTGFACNFRQHPEMLKELCTQTVQISEKYVVSCAARNEFTIRMIPLNALLSNG